MHVYEKSAKPGGLLVYGIPDFKMEKHIVERRVKQMEAEGVVFHCNVHVGKDVSASELEASHDAVLLAGGSEQPFDFFAKSPGRDLDGIHYAMTFLPQQNRRVAGEPAGATSRRSPPRASTSSSSAAATRAATASAPRSGRAPSR
mgnify:CR=1 FL=1